MKNRTNPRNQRGATLLTLLAAAGLVLALGAVVFAVGQSGPNGVQQARNGTVVASVMQQIETLRTGVANAANRGISAAALTEDNADGTGLYHPQVGGLTPLTSPIEATASGSPSTWGLANMPIPQIGTDAGPDRAFVLAFVNEGVCRGIVEMGQGANASLPAVPVDVATIVDGLASAANLTALARQTTGCVQASDGYLVFSVFNPT